jgi:hypothetical protein
MNTVVTGGYARLFNKIANGAILNGYCVAIPPQHVKTIVSLMKDAFDGKVIVSKPGETYNDFTGTDITICVGDLTDVNDDDILIPVNKKAVESLYNRLCRSFGMKVIVTLKNGNLETFRNVTEVHDNAPLSGTIIAIESNIHKTGRTFSVSDVKEFEVFVDTEFAPNF